MEPINTPPPDISPVTPDSSVTRYLPVFLPAVLIILIISSAFLLPPRFSKPSITQIVQDKILSPQDTVTQLLFAVQNRDLSTSGLYTLPATDYSACPSPLNPLSSSVLPENSYRIYGTVTESNNSLSYVTVSFTGSGQPRLYQLILLSSPPPWKLIACRDLGASVSTSTDTP